MISIVPATPDLVRSYYGKEAPWTFRGYVALDGDKPVGLAGVYREGVHLIAFFDAGPTLRASKRVAVEGRRLLRKLMDEAGRPVFAKMNASEPTAPALLRRAGFVPLKDDILVRMPNA
ncbi:MAG: hypothetical protein KGS44_12735 [Alphaproteobacteria bacterium]|nr:hypothetical protein [Alphaproteobacteria bacterium]